VTTLFADGLVLRPYEDDDAPAVSAAVRESMATVGRWMPWAHAAYSDDDARTWFAITHADRERGTADEFGVFDATDGTFIGGAGLNYIVRAHAFCNLGYWIRATRQRQGAATRCVAVLADHGFRELGMRRIEIVAAVGNAPSEGVARKSGALFECVARNRLLIGETSHDASVFSLVPDRIR
jgi:ribosomal-protein-serine acetyltransferase